MCLEIGYRELGDPDLDRAALAREEQDHRDKGVPALPLTPQPLPRTTC